MKLNFIPMFDKILSNIKKLPTFQKLILFGSLLTLISVFLPWYRDFDQYGTSIMFLGITGPLYLAGLIILIASTTSFGLIVLKLLKKPIPKLPLKQDHFHILSSSISIYMLIFTLSVFFHHQFGISLVDKSAGMGIILAFVGTGFVLLGGILGSRKIPINIEKEEHFDPVIDLESHSRAQKNINIGTEGEDTMKVKETIQNTIEDFTKAESAAGSMGDEQITTNDINV